ncbi:cytochrome C assembly family protein [Methylophilus methylotrophus]|uniref:cytochrome C assembly family protein n=1 Tax=Methylophilus methylotrophus TaxID=17 RepID=UPI0003A4F417|nr:cytochrome c biogenesis protein CcsA [Methylophilus methylotrophus]
MPGMTQHLLPYLIVAFVYMAVALDYWRIATQGKPVDENSFPFQLHSAMVALGLVMHGGLLYRDIFAIGSLNLGVFYALSAILWLTVLIYWLADLKHSLRSLQAFVLPPAALFVLMPGFAVKDYYVDTHGFTLFNLHILIAMVAYSLFTFAALHACLMRMAEQALHKKNSWLALPEFPPLMVLESLLFKVLHVGFVLLTITLISGMLFSEEIFGKPLQFNHKTIFSIASWLIYAWLLFGRFKYGWRGKTATRWTLMGFVLLLLAYIGSRFVLHVVLGR